MNFEEFKEGFVVVLSDAIDGLTVSSEEEQPEGILLHKGRFLGGRDGLIWIVWGDYRARGMAIMAPP